MSSLSLYVSKESEGETLSLLKDIYTLWYRTGANPRPLDKHFEIKGVRDFRDVVSRCKAYCDNCGYRFVKVERFLSDMAVDEALARQNS